MHLPNGNQPELLIVVDTEEEFDWGKPFSRDSIATHSIAAQPAAHAIYDRLGVVPTYVIDYPVATDPRAADLLGGLRRDGKAEIGAHLHPWVTPPHDEPVTTFNSYHCNLPSALEHSKIERLTAAIEKNYGLSPTTFKAGRYGFGSKTAGFLSGLGYQVDCSFVPHCSFTRDGGPSYRGVPDQPFWLDREKGLLEIPMTTGFMGRMPGLGPAFSWLFDNRAAELARLPGMLAATGLVARSRLTPEGISAGEQCRLLKALTESGRRTFCLAYHSPSLAPGHTPYVRSERDLALFLQNIEEVLTFFRDSLGGRFTTPREVYGRMARELRAADADSSPTSEPARAAPAASSA